MEGISKVFADNHRHCDEIFVSIEQAISAKDWKLAEASAAKFIVEMERHFTVEEEQLFPALEQATPGAAGPIQVMIMEHEQMRSLFKELMDSVAEHSIRNSLGISETLLLVMQQHNTKEENILYPMADRFISTDSDSLLNSLQKY